MTTLCQFATAAGFGVTVGFMSDGLRRADGNSSRARVKVLAANRAARQQGRITTAQVIALGGGRTTVRDWKRGGVLFDELPQVYAFGHPGRTAESDLFAAVLYAGPDAGLRCISGALWRGLLKWQTPPGIQVASPRRCRSLPADDPANGLGVLIEVRQGQAFGREIWNGIPTVSPAQIALDVAATGDRLLTRIVLANMDYRRILNERLLLDSCGPGVKGSKVLRDALANPQPRFARMKSWFEIRFVVLCEDTGIPLPATNEYVAGIEVDAVWWDEMLVVQLDGERNHGTGRQRARDGVDDQRLDALGFKVIRYRWDRLSDPRAIHRQIMRELSERRGRAARRYAA